ncbi:MAG: hypothetical protein KJ728_09435 [Alphaproteobacteria bacterium]|uniref:hypothetical protein n=1 Tax=Brevundimonas sp. TaxID=1871086 RepID=UPI001D7FA088|nr:hypothetical protein [Alphaproteobacteria bacterium]MBU1521632.1 hypothetical protein [Alphaproteobacteria bacterium]MBU2030932.1 hypothetical protein [Alphaproteobacteria bacterium]MBU2164379.1 hypothetical protein [Alphaproteobacteria bacterium]MBU2229834.1 hypothetical protein [Alphaproteobacteria bacterium]
MLRIFSALVGALAVVALPNAALAQTTVTSSRAAWVTQGGNLASRDSNSNSFTGYTGGDNYRSYISYAIPASVSAFTSAVIRVNVEGVSNGPNDLTVYDVSSDIATAAGTNLYADFGSGTVFGTITGLNTSFETVDITLNADGLAAVNAARGGEISFGFVSSPTAPPAEDAVFSASSDGTLRQLILTPTAVAPAPAPVPTMAEWAMILFGLSLAGGAALHIQRRRMFA